MAGGHGEREDPFFCDYFWAQTPVCRSRVPYEKKTEWKEEEKEEDIILQVSPTVHHR